TTMFIVTGLAVGLAYVIQRLKRRSPAEWVLVLGAASLIVGLGGLILPEEVALWVGVGTVVFWIAILGVLAFSGRWWQPLGWTAGAMLLFAFGGSYSSAIGTGLIEMGRTLSSLRPTQPWWLFCLLLVPLVIWLSFRSLAGLGPVRRAIALALRCAL